MQFDIIQPVKFTQALSVPLFVVLLENKLVPLVAKFGNWHPRSNQNPKISIFTNFHPSMCIPALKTHNFVFLLQNTLASWWPKLTTDPIGVTKTQKYPFWPNFTLLSSSQLIKCPFLCYYRLIIQRQGKIREIGPRVDVLHKILDRSGISYVSIGSVCSEKSSDKVKRFSFIVMGMKF